VRFAVLASGSGGNACFLGTDSFGLLIDAGIGPRQLAARLASVGLSWKNVHALVLTHTHHDHRNERTLLYAAQQGILFWCHFGHQRTLLQSGKAFATLLKYRLVRTYEGNVPFQPGPALSLLPLRLCHDGGPTFGFRVEYNLRFSSGGPALGYAADLGCWDEPLASALAGVDLLALEFNHDEALEAGSGRSERLIARVMGDEGHLSNRQASELLTRLLDAPAGSRLSHLVQLHLSADCNRPELARQAAAAALRGRPVVIHTARQDRASPLFDLAKAPLPWKAKA